jgi:hypothetical protein
MHVRWLVIARVDRDATAWKPLELWHERIVVKLFHHVKIPLCTPSAAKPPAVRAEIERQVKELGINYLLIYLFLGTMSLADALRSLNLFSSEVMPHLAKL